MKKIFSLLFFLVFSLFLNIGDCLAEEVGSELYNFSNESDLDKIIIKDNEKKDIPQASNEDIFGDEQAFPFIAGLGKNAAH